MQFSFAASFIYNIYLIVPKFKKDEIPMLLRCMSVLSLLILSSNMLSYAEEKTIDSLKANYVYTEASIRSSNEPVNFLMLGKDKNISSYDAPGRTVQPPSSCIVSGKSFVNCRR